MLRTHHRADRRRDAIAVIDAIEDHREIPDGCHIQRFMERSFVGSTVSEAAYDDLTRVLHLLSEGCTDSDTHTATDDPIGAEVAGVDISDVHRAALPLTDTICLTHDLSHHTIQVNAHSDTLTVATVIGGNEVALLQTSDSTDVSSFFAHGEVRHTRDFPTTHQLVDLVVEVADILHHAVHIQQFFFLEFSHNCILFRYLFDLLFLQRLGSTSILAFRRSTTTGLCVVIQEHLHALIRENNPH